MRTRSLLTGSTLLLGALIATGLVFGHAVPDPVLYSVSLSSAPWTMTLDELDGQVFVVSRTPAGSGSASAYGFASAGSYGFTVNGAAVARGLSSSTVPRPDTVSLVGRASRWVDRTVPVAADPGMAAVDIQDGLLYVTSEDENVVNVLDIGRLLHIRDVQVGTRPTAVAVSGTTHRVFVVNAGDGTVSMLDSTSGTVLRTIQAPAAVDSAGIAVDTGHARIYLAEPGSVSVLDARSGALLRTFALAPEPSQTRSQAAKIVMQYGGTATTALVDESAARLYVLDMGTLTTIDTLSDGVMRSFSVGSGVTAAAIDHRTGSILLARAEAAGGAGRLQVMDPRSGSIRRTIALAIAPVALAVDDLRGQVVVVGRNGERTPSDPWAWLPDSLRGRLPFMPSRASGGPAQGGSVVVLNLADLSLPR